MFREEDYDDDDDGTYLRNNNFSNNMNMRMNAMFPPGFPFNNINNSNMNNFNNSLGARNQVFTDFDSNYLNRSGNSNSRQGNNMYIINRNQGTNFNNMNNDFMSMLIGRFVDLESMGQLNRENLNPVDQNILEMLPEFEVQNLSKLPEDKRNCIICLSDFEVRDKAITLPCTHYFHTQCIKSWFAGHNTCPICKYPLDREHIGY